MEERKVTWVDRIKAPAKGKGQLDTKAKFPGLYLRTFAPRGDRAGRKVWFTKGRMANSGVSKFVLLGQYPAMDECAAEKAAADARWKMSQGVDPNAEREERMLAAKAASITFGALVDEYLRDGVIYEGRRLANTTIGLYTTCLRGRHLKPWHSRPLSAITQDEIDGLKRRLKKTNQQPLAALKAALRFAKERKYIAERPTIKITKAESDKAPMLTYHEGEECDLDLSELCIALDGLDEIPQRFPLSDWPAIWRFQCLTGQRSAAVLGARWEEFNLGENPTWHLSEDRSKLRRAITIPISEAAAALLRSLRRKESGLIWPNRVGEPRNAKNYPLDQLAVVNDRLRARGHRTAFLPSRFRDTFATWLESRPGVLGERAKALLMDHKAPIDSGIRGKNYAVVMSERLARKLANEWAATVDRARADAASKAPSVVPMVPRAVAAVAA